MMDRSTHDADPDVAVLDVMHDTTYRYATDVSLAHHIAYLRPADTAHQRVEHASLAVAPQPAVLRTDGDVFGNVRVQFSVDVPHDELIVRARSRVRIAPRFRHFDAARTRSWRDTASALAYRAGGTPRPQSEFVHPSSFVPRHRELAAYASTSFNADRPVADAAIDLMHRIHADFEYDGDSTEISTPVLEAFNARRGVCQDFAHVMIGGLRALGLAARYVSGYLLTQPPPGRPRLIGADASHAWVSVWCPAADGSALWLDLDPTNDAVPVTAHVTLAVGRDFGDISPLRGVIRGGGEHELAVGVTVQPVDDEASSKIR